MVAAPLGSAGTNTMPRDVSAASTFANVPVCMPVRSASKRVIVAGATSAACANSRTPSRKAVLASRSCRGAIAGIHSPLDFISRSAPSVPHSNAIKRIFGDLITPYHLAGYVPDRHGASVEAGVAGRVPDDWFLRWALGTWPTSPGQMRSVPGRYSRQISTPDILGLHAASLSREPSRVEPPGTLRLRLSA